MTELSGKERVMRALARQKPHRVPHFEWSIDRRVRVALARECKSLNEFAAKMGLDAMLAGTGFQQGKNRPWAVAHGMGIHDSGMCRRAWSRSGLPDQFDGRSLPLHSSRPQGGRPLCDDREDTGGIQEHTCRIGASQ